MDTKQKNDLLALARDVLENKLLDRDRNLKEYQVPTFNEKRGLFVTLMLKDKLRGCIGQIEPVDTIYKNVIRLAQAAAFDDHRFNPLTAKELSRVVIEISLLTIPEEVIGINNDDKIAQIRPHIDGVILKSGYQKSTFLPQVWESISTQEGFVSELCSKAGLPEDYSQDNPIEIAV